MKVGKLISYNVWDGTFNIRDIELHQQMAKFSRMFGLTNHLLYHKAWALYKRNKWLYDMEGGTELFMMRVFGIGAREAQDSFKLEVNELFEEIACNIPCYMGDWVNIKWVGYPIDFESTLIKTINYISGMGIIDEDINERYIIDTPKKLKTILRGIFFMNYNGPYKLKKTYEWWVTSVVGILHNIVSRDNYQLLDNILQRDLIGVKVGAYPTK